MIELRELRTDAKPDRREDVAVATVAQAKLTEMAKLEPARESRGTSNRAKGAEKASKASRDKAQAKKDAPKPEGELSVVSKMGRTKVLLFARPTKKGDKDKRAINLGQDPHGVELSLNGITIRYRVVKEAAGLTLIIERDRELAAAAE